ncbi:MAG: lipid-A-disaccharide synthase, partial [Planctomycetaceae bacterium]|nr:lipid-A-disaccharide synthase [Planctomycetaceae bacterium]
LFSLPNLIAQRMVIPENFRVGDQEPANQALTADVDRRLRDPRTLEAVRNDLAEIRAEIGTIGATPRVAELLEHRLYGEGTIVERRAA